MEHEGRRRVNLNSYTFMAKSNKKITFAQRDKPPQTETITLEQAREKLALKAAMLRIHAFDKDGVTRAEWFENMLAEQPLSPHGVRTIAIARLTHSIIYSLPALTDEQVGKLMWPSIEKMIEEGSKMTLREFRRIVSSSRAKYEASNK
jgi:hypothetical protein